MGFDEKIKTEKFRMDIPVFQEKNLSEAP